MVEAQGMLDWALNGQIGSNAPVISGGGARTAYQHGQLMAGYSPVFNTEPPSGLQPQVVTPTATLLPPTPGDVAPGSDLLIGLLIAAFILIAAGGYYLRYSRQ